MFFYENQDKYKFKPIQTNIELKKNGLMLYIDQTESDIYFQLFIEPSHLWVAQARAKFAYFKSRIACFYITSVIVMNYYRNQGYGTLLMKEVMAWLTEQNQDININLAMLHITQDKRNEKIRFYGRNGFVVPTYQESFDITALFYSFNEDGSKFIEKMNFCNLDYDKGYTETYRMLENIGRTWKKPVFISIIKNLIKNLKPNIEDGLPSYEGGKCEAMMDFVSRNVPEINFDELFNQQQYHYYIKS